jgi:plastocyanin
MNHRPILRALGLCFLLAVSAWGQHHSVVGNDYDDGPGGGDPNPATGCTGVQAKITVGLNGTTFAPSTVTVDPGQPVCWTWSGTEHTVRGDDGSFTSGPPTANGTFQRTFIASGTYGYHCQVHGTPTSGMRGTVVVRGTTGGSGAGTLALLSTSYTADEGVGALTVTVARTGGSDGAATVKYETASGTAKSKKDFTARTGTLSWGAGDQNPKTIEVPIKDDKAKEKNETFTVKLSKATGAGLGANSAAVTINDNDTPGGCGSSLAAPAQLQARGQSESEIHLTWADPSTASELRIERRQPGGTFREIASLAAGVQSFTDSDLPGGATFQYRVNAVGTDGVSAVSNIAAGATDGAMAPCDDANALCLDGGRFEASVEWHRPSAADDGTRRMMLPEASRSGLFSSSRSSDPQLLVNMVDGCTVNGHHWLYFAAVTDVEHTVKVRDTLTGRTWARFNPAGSVSAPVRDVEAFSCQ